MPKNKKNPFSIFLDSYYNEERSKGRYISKRIAVEECGPLWNSLSKEEKEFFYDRAKEEKIKKPDSDESTCDKEWKDPFLSTLAEERAVEEFLESAIIDENDLRHHRFYLIHVNYYCIVRDEKYVPGEIALCEFNLQGGIERKYHTLIHPGKIPLGYAYEAKRLINEVHGLPYPTDEGVRSNLKQISEEILEFMKASEDGQNNYPPLFTVAVNIKACTNIINELVSSKGRRVAFKVYEIDGLLYWLVNKCATYSTINYEFPKKALATTEIEKDMFRYCAGISCKFHRNLEEKYQNCSLSYVQRLAYVICHHCCFLLKIQCVPGKHVNMKLPKNRPKDGDENDSDDGDDGDDGCANYATRSDPHPSEEAGNSNQGDTCSSLCVDQSASRANSDDESSDNYGVESEPKKEDTLNMNE